MDRIHVFISQAVLSACLPVDTKGIELLTEEQYRELQKNGEFDTKTSSWVSTRKLGGALLCDHRYGTVFDVP